ncbi:MAG: type II toxin-antitoxin system RelB/DinJ family antitoxin [SAR324 cluster bacterium]|jgi:DNA-damage-inducible protein J|nr:type II toxin-antitoxin system RelB/DinJ family antitoxin [SAR324 cluster bacterium]|tara:strand:+ start:659 stop:913 length:255 start_codon:yes stop_codon:yes gene_type:complete
MAKIQTSLRIDQEKFIEAKEILSSLGMNFTEAVNIFTSMIVLKKGLPFEARIPNQETEWVLRDVRAGKNLEPVSLEEIETIASA